MDIVTDWIADQTRPSTKRNFKHHFTKFWTWIQSEGLFETPENLLTDYEHKTGKEKYLHIEIIKKYMKWLKDEAAYSINSRISALTALRSFYNVNHTPLPKLTRQDCRRMLEPTEKEIDKQLGTNPVKIKDLKRYPDGG